MKSNFWKAGHTPTLLSAFLYFDLSFMVWVLLGPLAVQIATSLHLSPAQKGLMVATPVLAGALLRIVMGVLVDQIKFRFAEGTRKQTRAAANARCNARDGEVADA